MDWGLRQWAPYLRSILLDSNAISIETNLTLVSTKEKVFFLIDVFSYLERDTIV